MKTQRMRDLSDLSEQSGQEISLYNSKDNRLVLKVVC